MTKSTLRFQIGRPVGLLVLLLAAVATIVLLDPRQALAALTGQNSPLPTATATVSPLDTPTSTPSPTPTATLPVPPTAEPSGALQAWPTPTPTPFAPPVQAAIDLLVGDRTLNVTNPEPFVRVLVDDPSTGQELTVVRLRDAATGTDYWVRAESEGDAALLPDFSPQALALVAAAEKVAESDLNLFQSFYAPFPFTRQLLWVGRVFNTKSGAQIPIALDLTGAEVDLAEAEAGEAEAVSEFCGALDVTLCVEILYAPEDASSNAVLVLEEDIDPEPIVSFLDEQQVTYEKDEDSFYFRMQNSTLRELARLKNIDKLQKDFPDEVRPLDTNLIIGLVEQSGQISLTLESQKAYPLLTFRVETSLEQVVVTQTQGITLLAHIDGIFAPATGPSALAPAAGLIALGNLNGRYNLAFAYTDASRELDLLDKYLLIVSDGRAVIRASETSFTWPKYTTWLRLPQNAVWFVAQARSADAEGTAIDAAPDTFAAKAQAFYEEIAGLRAQPLSLAEGIYTNRLFIPPWPTWQIPDGDFVRVPLSENHSYLFKWPDIRYFTYGGSLTALEEVVAAHCVDEVAIAGYTATGEVIDVCQP